MLGLMQDRPLLISQIIDYAAAAYPDVEIVTRTVEGPIHRYGYKDAHKRAKASSSATGSPPWPGTPAGTWSLVRHHGHRRGLPHPEPAPVPRTDRLSSNHAEDRIIFVDLTFVPMLEADPAALPVGRACVVMTDSPTCPRSKIRGVPNATKAHLTLVEGSRDDVAWGGFDEKTACGLCYTSGTTGNPKGVLYSHRSTTSTPWWAAGDVLGVSAPTTRVLPVVPMFHANAWGIAFAGPGRRRQAGHAGLEDGRRVDLRADRDRGRHLLGRRADRLADAAAAPAQNKLKLRPSSVW
jgi:hypothetical protein